MYPVAPVRKTRIERLILIRFVPGAAHDPPSCRQAASACVPVDRSYALARTLDDLLASQKNRESLGTVKPCTSPGARRPDGKARRLRILNMFDRGATQPAGMPP